MKQKIVFRPADHRKPEDIEAARALKNLWKCLHRVDAEYAKTKEKS